MRSWLKKVKNHEANSIGIDYNQSDEIYPKKMKKREKTQHLNSKTFNRNSFVRNIIIIFNAFSRKIIANAAHTQLEWFYSFLCCVQYCDCVLKSTQNEMKKKYCVWWPQYVARVRSFQHLAYIWLFIVHSFNESCSIRYALLQWIFIVYSLMCAVFLTFCRKTTDNRNSSCSSNGGNGGSSSSSNNSNNKSMNQIWWTYQRIGTQTASTETFGFVN